MEDTAGFKSHVSVSTVSYGSYLNILKCHKVSPDAQNVQHNGVERLTLPTTSNLIVALKTFQTLCLS